MVKKIANTNKTSTTGSDATGDRNKHHDAKPMTIDTTTLPVAAQQAIAEILRIVESGGEPIVTSNNEYLTTTEAALVINVTRPTIISWIEQGRLSAHLVGTHRRLLSSEVHALHAEIQSSRMAALDRILNP
jgi:excisionase family DNA binding protein